MLSMTATLFKYVRCKTALKILENKTLQWSAPDLFNDPFEFKSPFEFEFAWDELKEPVLQHLAVKITQRKPPALAAGNPVAPIIETAWSLHMGKRPEQIRNLIEKPFEKLCKAWAKISDSDRKVWAQMKEDYRVLCFSAVNDNILMWHIRRRNIKG
jgi:hypothetical protein